MFIKTTNNTADKIQAKAQFSFYFYIFHLSYIFSYFAVFYHFK